MNNYLISVVIPLYNNEHYIKNALDSVCSQTVSDIEIIVIDDGSTDNGAEVCRNYRDSRVCLIQQKNMGVSVARNEGIKKAEGELIAFLDSDDTWESTFLETILRLRKNFPNAGAYATSYFIYSLGGNKTRVKLKSIPSDIWEGILPDFFKLVALETMPFFTSSICVPKYVFQAIGNFPVGEHAGQDLDMWYRIALNYPIAYSSLPKVNYTYDSMTIKGRTRKIRKELQFIKTIRQAIYKNNIPKETKYWLNILLAKSELRMAKIHIINGNRSSAIDTLIYSKLSFITKIYWIIWAILPVEIFYTAFKINQYIKLQLFQRLKLAKIINFYKLFLQNCLY